MKLLDIAEVASRSGLPPSTLRFYEEKGLIASVGRHGLRRLFGPDVLERLALITLGRIAGFALDACRRCSRPAASHASTAVSWRPRLTSWTGPCASSPRYATACATRPPAPPPATWNARSSSA